MEIYQIATGRSRTETQWSNKAVSWQQLTTRLQKVKRTPETSADYFKMTRAQKGSIKDIGGFVGGVIKNGVRKAQNITQRTLITLDIDYGTNDTIAIIEDMLFGTQWCLYSTHSHSAATPRYRLVIPLARPVTPDQYIPIARRIADNIGIDLFDDSTYEPPRLMYWPSASRDADFIFKTGEGTPADPDKYLATYDDWRNAAEWPISHRVQRMTVAHGAKQEDPTTKPGIIGAFCRCYTITEAIEAFLPDVYTPTEHEDRWTYADGSTVGGALIYQDKWLYSHHGTDPCCEKLVNAFDMVRLHKFGAEDKEADPDTPIAKMPSFVAMEKFATSDSKTSGRLVQEKLSSINEDFAELAEEDKEWSKKLVSDKKGNILPTPYNFGLICRYDIGLRGKVMRDVFIGRDRVVDNLPWRKAAQDPFWNNTDDNGLIEYVSEHYSLSGKTALLDANDIAVSQNQCHPVREYLDKLVWDGVPRLETLLIDYLGADDSELVRAVTRKHFTAAVARVMRPGCKYDYILTLIGSEGIGKSTLIKTLGKEWFDDSLVTIEGKEGMEQIRGKWLFEIGELTNYKKSTSEAYKAFISKQEDSYRPAYGRKTEVYPRQCVFFATTNEGAFLKGDTGNRRFWTVVCDAVMAEKNVWDDLPGEVDQIWAEATEYYKKGEQLYLEPDLERQMREQQEIHNEVSSDERIGVIAAFLERRLPPAWESMTRGQRQDYFRTGAIIEEGPPSIRRETICAVEILSECFQDKLDGVVRYRTKEINQILRNMPNIAPGERKYDDCYGRQWRFRIIRKDE